MSLVDDDQVETPHTECLLLNVDKVDHRLISREQQASINVPGLAGIAEVALRLIRQISIELTKGLLHQGCAISQEEHVLYPIITQQHLNQCYRHTRFTSTSSHHQQSPAML